jgi:hypothetical protein
MLFRIRRVFGGNKRGIDKAVAQPIYAGGILGAVAKLGTIGQVEFVFEIPPDRLMEGLDRASRNCFPRWTGYQKLELRYRFDPEKMSIGAL